MTEGGMWHTSGLPQDPGCGIGQVGGNEVCIFRGEIFARFCTASCLYEDGSTTGVVASFQITFLIAYHERSGQVQVQVLGGLVQHGRAGFGFRRVGLVLG